MPTLEELARLLLSEGTETRPRRAQPQPVAQPSWMGDAPPEMPAVSAPPRSMPQIDVGQLPPPPSADTRPRFTDPEDQAHYKAIQPFGSSGEPFGSSRQRRTQPRDFVADELAYQRELEQKPRNKLLDVLSGITQGVAALDNRQPQQPVDFSGRTRSMNESLARLTRELGVQKEQSTIQAQKNLGTYRAGQGITAQQSAMIRYYNSSINGYKKGANPQIDKMYADAGMEFPDKPAKGSGGGRKYHAPLILPNGTVVMWNDAKESYEDAPYNGQPIVAESKAEVQYTDPFSGRDFTVTGPQAINAGAQAAGARATQGRFDTSEARQTNQFNVQQFQARQRDADKTAQDLMELNTGAQGDEAAIKALDAKKQQQGGFLYGEDAQNLVGYQSRAAARRAQAGPLAEKLRQNFAEFYDVGSDGVPRPKAVQPPAAPAAPAPSGSTGKRQLKSGAHEQFAKDYAAAKTDEERARLLKLFNEALQAAQ